MVQQTGILLITAPSSTKQMNDYESTLQNCLDVQFGASVSDIVEETDLEYKVYLNSKYDKDNLSESLPETDLVKSCKIVV